MLTCGGCCVQFTPQQVVRMGAMWDTYRWRNFALRTPSPSQQHAVMRHDLQRVHCCDVG